MKNLTAKEIIYSFPCNRYCVIGMLKNENELKTIEVYNIFHFISAAIQGMIVLS